MVQSSVIISDRTTIAVYDRSGETNYHLQDIVTLIGQSLSCFSEFVDYKDPLNSQDAILKLIKLLKEKYIRYSWTSNELTLKNNLGFSHEKYPSRKDSIDGPKIVKHQDNLLPPEYVSSLYHLLSHKVYDKSWLEHSWILSHPERSDAVVMRLSSVLYKNTTPAIVMDIHPFFQPGRYEACLLTQNGVVKILLDDSSNNKL